MAVQQQEGGTTVAGPVGEGPGLFERIARAPLEFIAIVAAVIVVVLPIVDLLISRIFFKSIPEASAFVDHSVLVLAFISAALASLDRRHLSLGRAESDTSERAGGPLLDLAEGLAEVFAVTTQISLFWASLALAFIGFEPDAMVWGIPLRIFALVIPLGFLLMAVFSIYRAGKGHRRVAWHRAATIVGLVTGSLLALSSIRDVVPAIMSATPAFLDKGVTAVEGFVRAGSLPLILLYIASAAFGAPIFTVLGGIAVVLYVAAGSNIALAPSEAYKLLLGGSISALPLFGLAGLLLAASGAGKRLVAVFREFFGWVRGGEAIATVLACAFFSTFTGVNGVTILALGGLLVTILAESGVKEGRARGLVTASGDIGLLLPPSAAVIVYAVNAQFAYKEGAAFDVTQLFTGALLPGLLLILGMAAAGVIMSPRRDKTTTAHAFDPKAAFGALKPAMLELLVPAFAVFFFFTGMANLREIAAFSVIYIVVIEALVKREFNAKSLLEVVKRALPIIGGTLVIIAAARGLSFYVLDSDVPAAFTAWIQARVTSPIVFLLALNVFLLAVGCLMDLYSAILVVSPFVIPLGIAFGVHPVHFGVIFIMNLCIGFLTPTVGMNIFLASYAFRKPVAQIVRETWPFLLVQLGVLMVITYVPWLSTVLLSLVAKG